MQPEMCLVTKRSQMKTGSRKKPGNYLMIAIYQRSCFFVLVSCILGEATDFGVTVEHNLVSDLDFAYDMPLLELENQWLQQLSGSVINKVERVRLKINIKQPDPWQLPAPRLN